jgi:hypothetical protein
MSLEDIYYQFLRGIGRKEEPLAHAQAGLNGDTPITALHVKNFIYAYESQRELQDLKQALELRENLLVGGPKLPFQSRLSLDSEVVHTAVAGAMEEARKQRAPILSVLQQKIGGISSVCNETVGLYVDIMRAGTVTDAQRQRLSDLGWKQQKGTRLEELAAMSGDLHALEASIRSAYPAQTDAEHKLKLHTLMGVVVTTANINNMSMKDSWTSQVVPWMSQRPRTELDNWDMNQNLYPVPTKTDRASTIPWRSGEVGLSR